MLQTKLNPFTVYYHNSDEFHHLKNEIFTRDSYFFETDNFSPLIIDAGAHIGLATLYFKKMYPHAQVISIEPNPTNFKLLETNIWENQLEDVTTFPVALDVAAGERSFFTDQSDIEWFSTSSFLNGAWNNTQDTQEMVVPTLPLSQFLNQPVDFLKMDIEGAEQNVLMAAGDRIKQIKHMIVEFHPHPEQSLDKLIQFLEQHRFQVTLWRKGQSVTLKQAQGLVLIEAVRR